MIDPPKRAVRSVGTGEEAGGLALPINRLEKFSQ